VTTVLALDVGSSSVRAQRFDERAEPLDELRRELSVSSDPDEIVRLVRSVVAGRDGEVDAVGTSCFSHSLLALDRKGRPLTPVLGWRDIRSAPAAERLRQRLDPAAVHLRTGAFLHPSFWPAKLAWLAETEPALFAEASSFVSFSEYLLGTRTTSLSMASGTGLLDLVSGRWDEELLEVLALDEERLPLVGDEPIWLDGACSNLGAGCTGRARAALMVGTSGALRILYETERPAPQPGLFLYRLDGRRVLEGGALSDGGNLYAWLGETLAASPREARDDHGLTFLPFLGGERSIGWDPEARGTLHGLTFETTSGDIRRAALEGVALRFATIAAFFPHLEEVVATGGALMRAPEWIQLMADGLGRRVVASAVPEASLRGAAVAALERLGNETPAAPLGDVFEPRQERAEAYRSALERQQRLYEVLRDEH
jgi:gluconokinase